MSRVIVNQNTSKGHKVRLGEMKINVSLGKEVVVCKKGHIQHIGHGPPEDDIAAEKGDTYLDLITGEIYQLEGL